VISFDRFGLLQRAESILSARPALARIVRPVVQGERVCRFVLPLELCKPQNRKRGAPVWQAVKHRQAVACLMAIQERRHTDALSGRPQVLCCRFSSVEPDPYSDWAKVAVDVLCAPSKRCADRLNIILDDAPKYAEIVQWWEPAPVKHGFVLIEVWTGKKASRA
jgi:hypothetical protein